MNRTSIRPAGQAGIVPSTKRDDPDWDAIRTPDGTVFIHFYAGIWERLLSPELAARFVPNIEPSEDQRDLLGALGAAIERARADRPERAS